MSENDNHFVTRTEWLDNNIKVDKKIDKIDRKHTDALNDLSVKVERQSVLQEQSLVSQQKSEKHLEKLSETMGNFGDKFVDMEYQVKDHSKQLKTVSEAIKQKKNYNATVVGAVITGIFGVIIASIGFAAAFF
ncbi:MULTISPECIES: hypothetical protein [Staphylococcus]|uniref:hypothetical protein n=1 Tax=Staphylococcus TaxID=1279 RepID=UPI000E06F82C|nr:MULTISPECIES: hypothetical protein [Staphylococcus]MDU0485547.1 hypothetical protein [Staphylococcus haemolyticus]SUM72711.1 hypothetical phage membrane protein [Staphylococcus hominis]